MAGLFYVTDHYGNEHVMSDKAIRDKIVEQSKKSNYNWLAPADELIKVCNNPKFDRAYAKDIKVAIVNCYANFLRGDCPGSIVYAYDAYNQLYDTTENMVDKQVLEVRKKFLKAFIRRNIFWNKHLWNIDETFWKAKNKWIADTTEGLLKVRHVKFDSLKDDLVSDFEKYIDEEMNKGNVIEKHMSYHIGEADPDKKVYSDRDDSQKQSHEPTNKTNDETLVKMAREINNEGVYKPEDEEKPKDLKGIMKIFGKKRK